MTCEPVNLTAILISLLTVFAGIAGILFWHLICDIQRKLNNLIEALYDNGHVKVEVFEEWQKGRVKMERDIEYLKEQICKLLQGETI